MRAEAHCINPDCAYRPPAQFRDIGPYRHLIDVDEPLPPCPTCGTQSLLILTMWDDEQALAIGRVVATEGVSSHLTTEEMRDLIDRHRRGDWGDLDDEDKHVNAQALEYYEGMPNGRVLSKYRVRGRDLYVITEAGRQSTTILFPEEY